jgi:hypothetical protein
VRTPIGLLAWIVKRSFFAHGISPLSGNHPAAKEFLN